MHVHGKNLEQGLLKNIDWCHCRSPLVIGVESFFYPHLAKLWTKT